MFLDINDFLKEQGFYIQNNETHKYILSDYRSFDSLGLNLNIQEFDQICCNLATKIECQKNQLKTNPSNLKNLFYPDKTEQFLFQNSGLSCMRLGFLIDTAGNPKLIEINSQTPSVWWECEHGSYNFFDQFLKIKPKHDYRQNLERMLETELVKICSLQGKSLQTSTIGLATCDALEDVFKMNFIKNVLQRLNLGQHIEVLTINRLDFDSSNKPFSLNFGKNLDILFLWYPFEWLLGDQFASGELVWKVFLASLQQNQTIWFNGIDSFLVQNKSFLNYLYTNLQKDSADKNSLNLLKCLVPTFFNQEDLYMATGEIDYIAKPIWGREGQGIFGTTLKGSFATEAEDVYDDKKHIYQPFVYSKPVLVKDKPAYFTLEKWVYKVQNTWQPGGMALRVAEDKIVDNDSLILFLN